MGVVFTVLRKVPLKYWAILAAVTAVGLLGYTTKTLYDKNRDLKRTTEDLTGQVEAKDLEYKRYQQGVATSLQLSRDRFNILNKELTEVKVQNDKLSQKLSKHDLETLMWNHPIMVRNRINSATRDLLHTYQAFGAK